MTEFSTIARNVAGRSSFARWLDTFLEEKGIEGDDMLLAQGPSGENHIPVGCLVEALKAACASDQGQVKHSLVRLDFVNAPIKPFLAHIAGAIAL